MSATPPAPDSSHQADMTGPYGSPMDLILNDRRAAGLAAQVLADLAYMMPGEQFRTVVTNNPREPIFHQFANSLAAFQVFSEFDGTSALLVRPANKTLGAFEFKLDAIEGMTVETMVAIRNRLDLPAETRFPERRAKVLRDPATVAEDFVRGPEWARLIATLFPRVVCADPKCPFRGGRSGHLKH